MNLTRSRHTRRCLCLLLFAAVSASTALGQTAVTNDDARKLVHEAIKKDAASAYIEQMADDGPNFLAFAAESPEGSGGSAIVGYFDVNKITGDVWEIAGVVCTRYYGADLHRAQLASRRQRNIVQQTYLKLHAARPEICN